MGECFAIAETPKSNPKITIPRPLVAPSRGVGGARAPGDGLLSGGEACFHPSLDIGLYIHIPFCRAKCAYCDFNSYAGQEDLIDAYVGALENEFHVSRFTFHVAQPETWNPSGRAPSGRSLEPATVYFGGGTPSLLTLVQVERILAAINRSFPLAPDAQVTLEANPGTVSLPFLQGLRALGLNRLSLGVQSLDDGQLRAIGRIHTAAQAQEAYLWARQAGFNINLDFIYGLPGQSLRHWQETLAQAISLAPEHLSLYALTLEEETPLGQQVACGQVSVPDADAAADMYELAEEMLGAAGYEHYEISNWARQVPGSRFQVPGLWSRHNLLYWRNQPYLGFGAGAHSSWDFRFPISDFRLSPSARWIRWHNVASPREYIARLQRGASPVAERESLSLKTVMAETMFLGLRLVQEGVRLADFHARFGIGMDEVYGKELRELKELELLELDDQRVRLSPRGRLLGNEVFQRFIRA